MRALMGLIKDRHGTYYAQKRVPDRLQQAVARVRGLSKPRLVFLKSSLATKNLKDANVRAKLVLADFDRTLAQAEALLKEPKTAAPLRVILNEAEIKRMAEYVYAKVLAWDVHPQLVELGFLNFVAERRKEGEQGWLFPTVAPDQKGALSAWAKWWSRYLRNHVGVKA
jgi:hypothetical protein